MKVANRAAHALWREFATSVENNSRDWNPDTIRAANRVRMHLWSWAHNRFVHSTLVELFKEDLLRFEQAARRHQ